LALLHRRDQRHKAAARTWQSLRKDNRDLLTTNLVIAEAHGLLSRRGGVDTGLEFLDLFRAPRGWRMVWAEAELTQAAVERWVRRYRDKALSLTDAVSFEVMQREGLRDAFAFDEDFARVGFRVV
jgi:predicted nucleic acid-binding protein